MYIEEYTFKTKIFTFYFKMQQNSTTGLASFKAWNDFIKLNLSSTTSSRQRIKLLGPINLSQAQGEELCHGLGSCSESPMEMVPLHIKKFTGSKECDIQF